MSVILQEEGLKDCPLFFWGKKNQLLKTFLNSQGYTTQQHQMLVDRLV